MKHPAAPTASGATSVAAVAPAKGDDMICRRCSQSFTMYDSLGIGEMVCQDCWEFESARLWWATVTALVPTKDEPLITEHDPPRIFDPDVSQENPKDAAGRWKPALHLVPQSANIVEAVVLGLGAQKYGGAYNWREMPVRASVYLSAAMRHLAQWLDGQDDDPESGVTHLAHARACLGILLDAGATGNLIDDRPAKGAAAKLMERFTSCAESSIGLG